MNADRSSRWRGRTTSARQDSPLPGHFPAAHAEPTTARARRRRIVTATGIGGAGLLGISLSTKAGSSEFYLLTMGLAGTWAAGALSPGPFPLGRAQGPEGAHRRLVVMPVLTGAGAFGLFYGASRLSGCSGCYKQRSASGGRTGSPVLEAVSTRHRHLASQGLSLAAVSCPGRIGRVPRAGDP